jgi:hypothetical protein
MFEDESEEVRAIITFVTKRLDNPPRYGIIRNEFPWAQDKWVKNWKRAKLFLEKKPPRKGGYPVYFIKKDFNKEATNLLSIQRIVSRISKGQVQEIEIPLLQIEQAIQKHVEKLRPLFKEIAWDETKKMSEKINRAREAGAEQKKGKLSLLQLIKRMITNENGSDIGLIDETGYIDETHPLVVLAKMEKYEEESAEIKALETEIALLRLASYTEIDVVYDKSEPLPILEEKDIVNLLELLARNVPAKIKKPWSLVVTFSIPEEDYIQ